MQLASVPKLLTCSASTGKGIPILVLLLLRVVLISGLLAFLFVFWMDRPVEFV